MTRMDKLRQKREREFNILAVSILVVSIMLSGIRIFDKINKGEELFTNNLANKIVKELLGQEQN